MLNRFKSNKANDKKTASLMLGLKDVSNPVLQVSAGSDLEMQMNMLHISATDLKLLKLLQPQIRDNITMLINEFYGTISVSPTLMRIIKDNSTVEKLKGTLELHIIEMFEGQIDASFISKRLRIAQAHVRIGLEQKWYLCAYQSLQRGFLAIIEQHATDKSEMLQFIGAVSKIISLEQQIVVEAYDQQINEIREREAELKKEVSKVVGQSSEQLAATSEQTSASIEEMTAQVEELSRKSQTGSELAVLSEEKAHDGQKQLQDLSQIMTIISKKVEDISKKISGLENTSREIQNIVGIVQGIADQTNLLALNAAIEAARAGEHGRGFAVVSNEVRKLSEQTKESVVKVSQLISHTNQQIADNASLVKEVEKSVDDGHENMSLVEQVFNAILSQLSQTRVQNTEIERDLNEFVQVISEIADASSQIATLADDLVNITHKL